MRLFSLYFNALDELIDAINSDIAYADSQLDLPEVLEYKNHSFFSAEKPQDLHNSETVFHGSSL